MASAVLDRMDISMAVGVLVLMRILKDIEIVNKRRCNHPECIRITKDIQELLDKAFSKLEIKLKFKQEELK